MPDTGLALDLLHEVRSMLTAGSYMSSYEGQIVSKLDKAIMALEGHEAIDVRFMLPRHDLVNLLTEGSYSGIEYDVTNRTSAELLTALLQEVLYDNEDGPQLEGHFIIMARGEEQ